MNNDLWRFDATDIAAGIRDRNFSAREVMTACLDRLNAVVESRPEEALAAAEALEARVKPLTQIDPRW